MLLKRIEKILDERDYVFQEWSGCFDLVARRKDNICLLKVLDNVDSIQETQANNLKMLSHNMSAFTAIIGTHTRREILENDVIYERYGISTMTSSTLSNVLDEKIPNVYRTRGGFFNKIDSEKLRRARKQERLTQKELAYNVGVSKKFIYEHEKNTTLSENNIVIRLEKLLGTSIIDNIDIEIGNYEDNSPTTLFEKEVCNLLKKMGFSTDTIYQTPFNIIAKEKIMVLSDAEDNDRKLAKNLPALKSFSEITKKPAIVISNNKIDSQLPTIESQELKDLSIKDLKKIVKKW
ncbi:MAG: hypothetical protein HY831_03845 [Candidatus Aenigmarchaeota archaeon]|nr:hypothetical protein [Candidatus Aenigmarchaeota archaeon]